MIEQILKAISEAHLCWPDETPFLEWPERVAEFKKTLEAIEGIGGH